ncbi:MAG: hypothetical protein QOK27_856, partial [Gemmatimonadales bacterium]|nr:hypothetical protein [Gemmatimonadales bacterium]
MNGVATERSFAALRMTICAVILLTAYLSPLTLAAQIPDEGQYPEDTLSDTLYRDTVNTTARFLKEQGQVSVRVPVLPMLGVEGPKPALTRIVFNRDSIEWGHAATVGDLLTQVPGVYLWRGGFIGRPELVDYHARGNTSAEYY